MALAGTLAAVLAFLFGRDGRFAAPLTMPGTALMAADQAGDRPEVRQENRDTEKPSRVRQLLAKRWVQIAIVVIVAVLLVGAVLWWLNARQYESTDDAYVATHIVEVAPQVSGRVLHVFVRDNENVRAGQLLVEIDPATARTALAQALAQRAQAKTQLQQARDNANVSAAQLVQAQKDLARYRGIAREAAGAIAPQKIDQAVAAAKTAAAQHKSAIDQIAGAQAQIKTAQSQVETARLNLRYTRVRAPESGHVTQRNVAVGNYVSAGTTMMAIVPLRLWVEANFKETQLDYMHRGQLVTISFDACGGADVKGHVDSIQRGAGQAFQVLPPENATGNFIKVVQRVPVKITLDALPKHCVIGPGMSVQPTVKVR